MERQERPWRAAFAGWGLTRGGGPAWRGLRGPSAAARLAFATFFGTLFLVTFFAAFRLTFFAAAFFLDEVGADLRAFEAGLAAFRAGAFFALVAFRAAGREADVLALRADFFTGLVAFLAVGRAAFFLAIGGSFRLLDSSALSNVTSVGYAGRRPPPNVPRSRSKGTTGKSASRRTRTAMALSQDEHNPATEPKGATPPSAPAAGRQAPKTTPLWAKDDESVSPEEFARLLDLYDNSFRNIAEGEVVKGTVLKVTENEVVDRRRLQVRRRDLGR